MIDATTREIRYPNKARHFSSGLDRLDSASCLATCVLLALALLKRLMLSCIDFEPSNRLNPQIPLLQATTSRYQLKMKTSVAYLLTFLAATVLATPFPDPSQLLSAREVCNHPGECGWFESGQCEYHCDGYGGFQYMQECGWGRKRCCCVEATE
ncbi:hypothetical protein F66182_10039 [Fusarium sp. NRRL 66182]|nr:hypothetical protein F66182_10039 [Fusarium sp. NRRL 66182]